MMSIDDEILLGYSKKSNNTSNSININHGNKDNHFLFDDLVTPTNSYNNNNSNNTSNNWNSNNNNGQNNSYRGNNNNMNTSTGINGSGNFYGGGGGSNYGTPNHSYSNMQQQFGTPNNSMSNMNGSGSYYGGSYNNPHPFGTPNTTPQQFSANNTPLKNSSTQQFNLDDDDEFFNAIRSIDRESSSSKLGDSTSQLNDSTASYASPSSPLSGSTNVLPQQQMTPRQLQTSPQRQPSPSEQSPLSQYKENLYASFIETDPANLKAMGELVKEDSDTFVHVISDKDTLQGLTIRYNCSIEELKQLNKLVSNTIHERSVLVIPKKNNQTPQQKEDIFNNKDMEETMRKRVIGRFMKMTGCSDQDQAVFYLERSTFDFYKAVHDYQKESNIEVEFPKPVPTSPLRTVPLSILAQQASPTVTVAVTGTSHSSSSPHDILNNSDALINSFKDLYKSPPRIDNHSHSHHHSHHSHHSHHNHGHHHHSYNSHHSTTSSNKAPYY
ncbi:hypothetical protein PPL_08581 [Heterostelium album PN500]|uniref:LysM domain-containing protein n=1 Tax=Heterostelium pallidum (strain ATCC 26659 / Pp 5 / PN500) TaxID=670386 RepID=D3BJ56_HETP5|nr:hypothetical protein PPL_08581 [Heterostelium album PN500]EFA77936.1 hypothetical protein PPL_08581 [Heterostelium album PN500]|eukprot:XP_020430064.1 hypothetical protein PPL_08581 [Heterostelium album PN500]